MHTALLLSPDFALILLGAGIRRWMHLGDHFWSGVEKLVYFILFPALLINAIVKTRLDLGAALPLLATALAAMVGGMLLGLLAKPVARVPELTFASLFQCPEQFLSSGSNQRHDQYGGPVENRARFILEILDGMAAEAGADRVGIKIAPEMNFNDIVDASPRETYTYLVDRLDERKLAYLHVALFGAPVDYHALLRPRFAGAYLMGGGLDQQRAESALASGSADAAVFGGAFLANPDLPERFRRGAALNTPNRDTFYAPGPEGYIDYPALD